MGQGQLSIACSPTPHQEGNEDPVDRTLAMCTSSAEFVEPNTLNDRRRLGDLPPFVPRRKN
jgi:hypothetical protein